VPYGLLLLLLQLLLMMGRLRARSHDSGLVRLRLREVMRPGCSSGRRWSSSSGVSREPPADCMGGMIVWLVVVRVLLLVDRGGLA
jgi:hypothetical protein